ncbi:MAG: hypothetical protein U1F61_30880 [Opitutaceae bacterium]
MAITPSGDIILSGFERHHPSESLLFTRLTSDGTTIWRKTHPITYLSVSPAPQIALGTDGNIFTSFQFIHTVDLGPQPLFNLSPSPDQGTMLARLDGSSGDTDWSGVWPLVAATIASAPAASVFIAVSTPYAMPPIDLGGGPINPVDGNGNPQTSATLIVNYSGFGSYSWSKQLAAGSGTPPVLIAPGGSPVIQGGFKGSLLIDGHKLDLPDGVAESPFLARLDPSGLFIASRTIDCPNLLAAESPEAVFLVGYSDYDQWNDCGCGKFALADGRRALVVSKVDSSLACVWSTSLGTTDIYSNISVSDAAVDNTGGVVFVLVDNTEPLFPGEPKGGCALARLDSSGTLSLSTRFECDGASAVAVDADSNILVAAHYADGAHILRFSP